MADALFFHASPVAGLSLLTPHVSNHGQSLLYLSQKRENVLVYLSNAVEKHCRENQFCWNGPWRKWGPYGFTKEGIMQLEEYYPNALEEVYKGVSGVIYSVAETDDCHPLAEIRDVYVSVSAVPVTSCEMIPDAYEAILKAEAEGKLVLKRYHQLSSKDLSWLERAIQQDYAQAENHPEYRFFLQSKFEFLNPG